MEISYFEEITTDLIRTYGGDMTNDLFSNDGGYADEPEAVAGEPDDIIILHMDIREPLMMLQKLVEHKIGVDLKGYTFWLQDSQELEPHKNLVDQCVKGEGLVQINVQIQTVTQRINIMDVLKPTEAALAAMGAEEKSNDVETLDEGEKEKEELPPPVEKPCLNWVLDTKFRREQVRLKIPEDPNEWTPPQVKYWLQWAIRQFDLADIKMSEWELSGQQLCDLTHEKFCEKVKSDPGNVFWTHLQLLKECNYVSVVRQASETATPDESSPSKQKKETMREFREPREPRILGKTPGAQKSNAAGGEASPTSGTSVSNMTISPNHNGQVQLWQFLLELLTDREHVDIIQWVGTEGEFKLSDPEAVARLWGVKKNKPAMNYEKLSRALRYYYDGDMISKVAGKRFAYKFDCDLKLLIGYDAAELSRLVIEKTNEDEYLQTLHEMHNMQKDDDE